MKNKPVFAIIIAFMILMTHGHVLAAPDYAGTWVLEKAYLNGAPVAGLAETLVISATAFNSITEAPPEKACAYGGPMVVTGDKMRVTVGVGSCPGSFSPGSEIVFTYNISQDWKKMTLSALTGEGELKRVYVRLIMHGSGEPPCSHPFCGIYNRTHTYVGEELMNQAPAYTVITGASYYSITDVCYNLLTMDSVEGPNVKMTMTTNTCPGGVMPPGTVVISTFKLSEDGDTLTVVNTQYGAPVKTIFKRLR